MINNNKRTKNNIFVITIFIFIVFLFVPHFSQAQERQAVSISPLNFDLTADPGDTLTNEFMVYNSGSTTLNVRLTVEDFLPVGEEGRVRLFEPDPELDRIASLAKWTTIESDVVSLEPRQQAKINFIIEVPEDAEPGTRYGSIVVNIGDIGAVEGGGSAVVQKVGALVLLSVSGEVEEKLIVKEFKGPDFQEYGPIDFVLKLENQGTVHLRPKGFVVVNDWRNNKVAELYISQSAVLPGAVRLINIPWNKKNIIGKFTANLIGSYGLENKSITASWTFWVWPWKISLIFFIIFLLLLFIIIRGRRRIGAALRILFKGEGLQNQAQPEKKEEASLVDQSQSESSDQNLQT